MSFGVTVGRVLHVSARLQYPVGIESRMRSSAAKSTCKCLVPTVVIDIREPTGRRVFYFYVLSMIGGGISRTTLCVFSHLDETNRRAERHSYTTMAKDRLQTQRFELKYLLREETALAIRRYVSCHLKPDEFAASLPNYSNPVHTLY